MDIKSKLQEYYKESIQIGALKGFHYFEIRIRGREELEIKLYPYQCGTTRPLLKLQSSSLVIPPASPTPIRKDRNPVFLIAAYQKYKAPFVWMRSNHHLLSNSMRNFDYQQPLKLISTKQWEVEKVFLHQILDQVVQLFPCENPFKIRQDLFKNLESNRETVLYSAAMIYFLIDVFNFYPAYQSYVKSDLQFLHEIHFDKIIYKSIAVRDDNSGPPGVIRC